jgi:hypothetical protein
MRNDTRDIYNGVNVLVNLVESGMKTKLIPTGFRLEAEVKTMLKEMSEVLPATRGLSQNRIANLAIRMFYRVTKRKESLS